MGDQEPTVHTGTTTVKTVSQPRHEWYQTDSHVVISIFAKKVAKESVAVTYSKYHLQVVISPTPSNPLDCSLKFILANDIDPERCSHKTLSTKIEIKMAKAESERWQTLEKVKKESSIKQFKVENAATDTNKYPSSAHYTRNWDKLVCDLKEEEKNEEPEGEEALNKLFQQIYGDGSDETRKAMNKSFVESGGTVLSTNWNEIGKEKVEVKPPDGMDFKKTEM